ncbi:murein L,D-transpeptidase [Methylocapsa sp. S129]|uniref:L,D-transpeptidase family protein n=1 Tax=Methylocapsa sp. S129 TaxID=1641869 RepID=UPI00131AFFE0|nr:L,D-transpeptidase family protein [Methylocapsa sp. S129]
MTRQGKSFGLASVCVAAVLGFCLHGPVAHADETAAPTPPVAIDMTPTGALRTSPTEAPSVGAPPAGDEGVSAGSVQRQADQASAPFQPELPPDAANEPSTILAPSSIASSAQQSSPEKPGGDGPVAKLNDETAPAAAHSVDAPVLAPSMSAAAQPGDLSSTGASATEIEAAVEAMLKQDVKAAPTGVRDTRAARLAVGVFYFERAYAPLWTNEDGFTPHARAAIARLRRAREDGLDLSAFAIPSGDGKGDTAAQRAQADVMLSQAIIFYAVQASGGRIQPSSLSPQITAKPDVAEPFKALALVAAANDPDAALEDFNPPQKGYRDLRDKLAQLRADNAPVARIPTGPMLKIGMVDPRVPLIRTRFGLDALAEGQASGALVYDAQVAALVADFQRANGLPPSGLLTANTVQALSGGASSRQEADILANMEMWRWEPRDMGEERVEVNVPDFTLKVTQGDEVIHRARVIVGKPTTPTAIFSNQIKYLLVNPAWNVPISIIKKEMMPKLAADPDYLTRAGFEVTEKNGILTVRQPPGERNALGHILFMFPNEHSIYLHDTPARGMFTAQRRAFSHGCVRVDDPMRLGELVMGGAEAGWTQARLRSLVGNTERTIFLPRPLAIHIEYFTAFVDDSGALQTREDIYGFTRQVEAALGLEIQG